MCSGIIREIQTTPAVDLRELAHANSVSSFFCQLCQSELHVYCMCFDPFQNRIGKGELLFEEEAPCV